MNQLGRGRQSTGKAIGMRIEGGVAGGQAADAARLLAQPGDFVARLSQLISPGCMARVDEYQGAVPYLCSGASPVTGSNLVTVGGKACR
jgi:hypothetical protein